MSIILSGASGELGRGIAKRLLDQVPAEDFVLLTRNPDSLAEFANKGVTVRRADFDDAASLPAAFAGGHILLIISTLSVGRRVEQHRNAVEAARRAGVGHVAYTSLVGLQPQNPSIASQEHIATEALIRESGLDFTFLRNSWYADVIPQVILPQAVQSGALVASTGDGYIAPVSKRDCINSAAAVLMDPRRHANCVYEITGPELYNFEQIAALCSETSGREIRFQNVSHEEKQKIFDAMGVNRDYQEGMMNDNTNAWASNEMISFEKAIKQNYFSICSRYVDLITGQPALTLREVLEMHRHHYQQEASA